MRFTEWILLAVLSITAASAQAANDCVPATEMQEIASHFTQFQELANKGEYCFDNSQTSHLIAGIMFMRKTRFAPAMPASPDELFSGAFKNDWYSYFIGRITDFEVQNSCPKGVVAYVYFFGTTMYVCPLALTDAFTALDRASVFMHEARHIDGYPHMTCSRGPREGLRGACDRRISDGGSYAVTVETYAQIAKYAEDLHPAMRAFARSSAVVYADEAFENPVRINRTSQFLLMTSDRRFHAMSANGEGELKELGLTPQLGQISMRGQHMLLFPEDKTQKAVYVFARDEGETQQQGGDIATEYNNQTPTERAQLVAVHSSVLWNARVYRDKVRFACDPTAEGHIDVSVSETPAALLYPDGYDRAMRKVHLISESGRVFEIGCEGTGRAFVRDSSLKLDQPYKRVLKLEGEVVGLSRDGRLFRLNNGISTPLQTPVDGRVHEIVPNQYVEFLDAH